MEEELTIIERKDRRKGRNYSITIHIILLLLLFIFWRFPDDPNQSIDEQYAVAVEFTFDESSNSTSGQQASGAPPAEKAEKDEQASPEPAPQPVEEVVEEFEDIPLDEPIVEQKVDIPVPEVKEVVEEDSPVEAAEDIPIVNEKVDIPKPKPVVKPKPKATGTGTGSSNTSTTTSSKNGTGKGDGGNSTGKDKTGNSGSSGVGTAGNGKGKYDGGGKGEIFGRKVIYVPVKELSRIMVKSGVIEVKVCIDPYGIATYTEINYNNTSIKDRDLLKKALQVAELYRYEKDLRAPDEVCGRLTFRLTIPE